MPDHMERLRFQNAPLMAYGALFSWDTALNGLQDLRLRAWCAVAERHQLPPPDMDDVVRTSGLRPELALARFLWDPNEDWPRCQSLAYEYAESLGQFLSTNDWEPVDGIADFLKLLRKYSVPCLLSSPFDEHITKSALESAALDGLFDQFITSEDGCESVDQAFLLGCVKLKRPPMRVVAFVDEPRDVIQALDATLKVVAVYGKYPAYDMRPADAKIGTFSGLTVMDIKEFFRNEDPR